MTNAPLDDLLATMDDNTGGNDKPVDLLNEIDDSGAPAWVPENAGEGIQGVVVSVTSQPDDYDPNDTVPVVTLKTADGGFRVIGFATVLRREIREKDPRPGDTFAVKYLGQLAIKKGANAGKPYRAYRAAIAKAPQSSRPVTDAPPF